MLLTKLHKWHDRIKGPYRFINCLVVGFPLFLAQVLLSIHPIVFLVPFAMTVWIMLTRLHYLYGKK